MKYTASEEIEKNVNTRQLKHLRSIPRILMIFNYKMGFLNLKNILMESSWNKQFKRNFFLLFSFFSFISAWRSLYIDLRKKHGA